MHTFSPLHINILFLFTAQCAYCIQHALTIDQFHPFKSFGFKCTFTNYESFCFRTCRRMQLGEGGPARGVPVDVVFRRSLLTGEERRISNSFSNIHFHSFLKAAATVLCRIQRLMIYSFNLWFLWQFRLLNERIVS